MVLGTEKEKKDRIIQKQNAILERLHRDLRVKYVTSDSAGTQETPVFYSRGIVLEGADHVVARNVGLPADWRDKMSILLCDCKPGITEHLHPNEHETLTVIDGEIAVIIDGIKYELGRGDSLPIDAGVMHKVIIRQESLVLAVMRPPLS